MLEQTASPRRLPSARTGAGSPVSQRRDFPGDGEQGRPGYTLTERGGQGQQRGMWTDCSFPAAGRVGARAEFPRAGRRGAVSCSVPVPIAMPHQGLGVGNAALALGTAGLRADPSPRRRWIPGGFQIRAPPGSRFFCVPAARERPPRRRGGGQERTQWGSSLEGKAGEERCRSLLREPALLLSSSFGDFSQARRRMVAGFLLSE